MSVRVLIAEEEVVLPFDLVERLKGLGYEVCGEAKTEAEAISLTQQLKPDVILMLVRTPNVNQADQGQQIALSNESIVVVVRALSPAEFLAQAQTSSSVEGYSPQVSQLSPAIELALHRHNENQKLKKEIDSLKAKLESRKIIERAKGYLMDRYHIGEQEAFRFIQTRAMATRYTMEQVSESILDKSLDPGNSLAS